MIKVKAGEYSFWMDRAVKENLDFVTNQVLNKDLDFVAVTDGTVGSGKTTLSSQICKYLDETFPGENMERVVFTPKQFLEVLSKGKKGQAVMMDEAYILSSRSALSEFNKKVVTMMAQIRSRQMFIFFCIPSIFDLDRNIALHRANMLLHTYQKEFGKRGTYIVFDQKRLKTLYLLGKKTYSYGRPKSNLRCSFPNLLCFDRELYNKKKFNAIKVFDAKPMAPKYQKWLFQRDTLIKYVQENVGITVTEMTNLLKKTLARQEISRIYQGGWPKLPDLEKVRRMRGKYPV